MSHLNNSLLFFNRRRSPKRAAELCKDHLKPDPVKLSQESFRLLRTAQNLLSLKDPILSESGAQRSQTSSSSSSLFLNDSLHHPKDGPPPSATSMRCSTPTLSSFSSAATMHRKLNTRESRLSIQSSTDDSVHSTSSSSRHETDEELVPAGSASPTPPPTTVPHTFCKIPSSSSSSSSSTVSSSAAIINRCRKSIIANSAADDESGFSSMNSFQEIGLPMSNGGGVMPMPRTRLSTASIMSARSSSESSTLDETLGSGDGGGNGSDNNNTTVKMRHSSPTPSMRTTNSLPPTICHRRWSSAPPIPPKRNLSTFNSAADEPLRVLWV